MQIPLTMSDDEPLDIAPDLRLPLAELEYRASRSGGPGGQHVNTSSTRIELWWNVAASPTLTEPQRASCCGAWPAAGWRRPSPARIEWLAEPASQSGGRDRAAARPGRAGARAYPSGGSPPSRAGQPRRRGSRPSGGVRRPSGSGAGRAPKTRTCGGRSTCPNYSPTAHPHWPSSQAAARLRSRLRYWMASLTWVVLRSTQASRSAMVRAILSTR